MEKVKNYYLIIISAVVIVLGVFSYFRFLNEDSWLCQNGNWVKHGNPTAPIPTSGCTNAVAVDGTDCAQITDMDACTKQNDCVAVDDNCPCYTYNHKALKCGGAVAFCEVCPTNTKPRCERLLCPNANVNISADSLQLATTINGCAKAAEQTKNETTLSTETGIKIQPPSITVEEGVVTYTRAIEHACCLEAAITKAVTGSIIKLTEAWTGTPCKCMCASSLSATVSLLPAGEYRVEVYEAGGATAISASSNALIISKPITIK